MTLPGLSAAADLVLAAAEGGNPMALVMRALRQVRSADQKNAPLNRGLQEWSECQRISEVIEHCQRRRDCVCAQREHMVELINVVKLFIALTRVTEEERQQCTGVIITEDKRQVGPSAVTQCQRNYLTQFLF